MNFTKNEKNMIVYAVTLRLKEYRESLDDHDHETIQSLMETCRQILKKICDEK